MHPNCRHEFLPFVEEMQSPEQLQKLIQESNTFKDFNPKDEKLFHLYNHNQALQRQWIQEYKEYNQLKIYFNSIGQESPYKTLRGFRRASRSKSKMYMETHRNVLELGTVKKDEKILDFYHEKGYNETKTKEMIEDLNRQYLEEVKQNKVLDVGFRAFAKTFVTASDELIGKKTSDGRTIKEVSIHFVERLFGDGTKAHRPVQLRKAIDTLFNGKVNKSSDNSLCYFKNDVRVTYNFNTNKVIQCNLDKKSKKEIK